MAKKEKVLKLNKESQIDLNKHAIDKEAIADAPAMEKPPEDPLDIYIKRVSPGIVTKYEESKHMLFKSEDLVHMIIREFCLDSNFFYSNSTWGIRLHVGHLTDKANVVPEKTEQFVLPPVMSDRKYVMGDFVKLGKTLDSIGEKQAGPAMIQRVEHHLYSDNTGILWLAKTFVQNEEAYNAYVEEVKKRAPVVGGPKETPTEDPKSTDAEESSTS